MRRAYHADSALAAEAELCALAAELDRTHPGAAASLREAGKDRRASGNYVLRYRWEGGGLFGGRSLRLTGFSR